MYNCLFQFVVPELTWHSSSMARAASRHMVEVTSNDVSASSKTWFVRLQYQDVTCASASCCIPLDHDRYWPSIKTVELIAYSEPLTEYDTLEVALDRVQPYPLPTLACSLPPGEGDRRS